MFPVDPRESSRAIENRVDCRLPTEVLAISLSTLNASLFVIFMSVHASV